MDTDREIQRAIRKEFTSSTVLMIAHRLQTVIDCDVIMVLSKGVLTEFGHPFELLQNTKHKDEHSFHQMVEDTGPIMSKQLYDLARLAYEDRR